MFYFYVIVSFEWEDDDESGRRAIDETFDFGEDAKKNSNLFCDP